MKILELFSGYGTASFALKRLGIDYELVGYSDIDKYANQCFKQNHCPDDIDDKLRLWDVKQINSENLEDFDLLTGGFPCQSFSVAGKGLGEADPRGTLFNEIIKIAEVKQPKYMLLENVKGLTNKTHKKTFDKILSELDRIGYNVYWKVLNSKDYGIPQSRARVWFVCFRKDIDKKTFQFPEPTELRIFIKDILEDEVDEKYYLSEKIQERFLKYLKDKNIIINPYNKYQSETTSGTIGTSVGGATSKTAQIVAMRSYPRTGTKEKDGERTQNFEPQSESISNTISSVQKDNLVFTRNTLSQAMGTGGNNVPMIVSNQGEKAIENKDVARTIMSRDYKGFGNQEMNGVLNGYRLRRLTPKECFRLMGFLNDEINLDGLSDTRRYILAGNGQDVNMVSLIFKQMFN